MVQENVKEKGSGLITQTGWNLPEKGKLTPPQELINELYRTTTPLDNEDTYNSFIQIPLLDYVKTGHPRVLFVGYGETDNWAHQGRYDLVLESAHGFDSFVQQLWETLQAMPESRGQTTFTPTTAPRRARGPADRRWGRGQPQPAQPALTEQGGDSVGRHRGD